MRTILMMAVVVALAMVSRAPAQEQAPPQPTKHHEILKRDVGEWDAEFKFWPQGPDSDPVTTEATETNRLLGNGMWLISEFRCKFGPMDFTGHGQFGYDPVKKKYVGTWIDNVNPHMSRMEGTYDEATKTMTMKGESRNPQTGDAYTTKNVAKEIDADNRVFTMYMQPPEGGDNFIKMMEITYKRRK